MASQARFSRVPRRTYGSRGVALHRWNNLRWRLGVDHPASIAALGRLRFYRGDAPQRDLVTPDAVAWTRESGAVPGYMNRREREHRRNRSE